MASVVTRDVSETGRQRRVPGGPELPLYRLVYFQVDRTPAIARTCRASLRKQNVLSAIFRVGHVQRRTGARPSTRCGCWSNRKRAAATVQLRKPRPVRSLSFDLLRLPRVPAAHRPHKPTAGTRRRPGERARGFFLSCRPARRRGRVHQHAVERQLRVRIGAQFPVDRDRAVEFPLRDLRFRHPSLRRAPVDLVPRLVDDFLVALFGFGVSPSAASTPPRGSAPRCRRPCSGTRPPPSISFGSAASSFSCSVGNVPGCWTGIGLPGPARPAQSRAPRRPRAPSASEWFALAFRDCRHQRITAGQHDRRRSRPTTILAMSRPRVSMTSRARATDPREFVFLQLVPFCAFHGRSS